MKLGVFGGTFNPIHYGHLRAAEEVREKIGLDKILFVPSGNPPLKTKGIADAKHRYEMTRVAIKDNKLFEISDIEYKFSGKSYTVKTLKKLKKLYPDTKFYFIIGIDAFLDIPHWWHNEELFKLTYFVITSRPRYRFVDLGKLPDIGKNIKVMRKLDNTEIEIYTMSMESYNIILLRLTPLDISSTEIRNLIKQNKSIKYLLPAPVESYIISNKLYIKD